MTPNLLNRAPITVPKDIKIHGAAIGLDQLTGLKFSPHADYTYCRLCGEMYQTDLDRNPRNYVSDAFDNNITLVRAYAEGKRKEWSRNHAKTHTDLEHRLLALSGRHLTPEAAERLAPFGVIVISPDEEVQAALYESKPIPKDDAEGSY